MKLAVMADGRVGRAVVQSILSAHALDLGAVVVDDAGEAPLAIERLCAGTVPVLRWRERARLRGFSPDVLLLAWWPHIIRGDDLSLAPIILNTHPSLLPHGRGKDPNFWALVEARPFGVTIHHVEAAIDAGPIAFQKEIRFDWVATGATLYRAAEDAMIELVAESYPAMRAGAIPRIAQDPTAGSFHRRAELDPASQIDLDAPTTGRKLLNLLRARTFPPYRACRFDDAGETYEIRVEIRRVGTGSD